MKFLIIKLLLVSNSILPILKNPMSMGFILMIQTMLVIMLMNKIMASSWFMMITFLMMIGGLLIIFSYMSSIASNEKFKIKINISMIFIILMIMTDEMLIEQQCDETQSISHSMNSEMSLIKIYNSKSMMMTILLVIYLLISMLSVSKLVKIHEGPLRSYKK
uniref:NADH dehydrogenase subunit 6 n=1 Tax=Cassianeura bimaculata TaxID=2932621 RepID=UPI001FF393CD|nr:NADH dehydrogenase subunit 6 [Cassianeura bimaculata]UOH96537.1 NADH dehydrogenase subunit 6 [Cassianeura bimaculata]